MRRRRQGNLGGRMLRSDTVFCSQGLGSLLRSPMRGNLDAGLPTGHTLRSARKPPSFVLVSIVARTPSAPFAWQDVYRRKLTDDDNAHTYAHTSHVERRANTTRTRCSRTQLSIRLQPRAGICGSQQSREEGFGESARRRGKGLAVHGSCDRR